MQLRLKPKSERLELSLPLDTVSENYYCGAAGELRLDRLTLRSKPAEIATPVAMGVFRHVLFSCHKLWAHRPPVDDWQAPKTPEDLEKADHPIVCGPNREGRLFLMPVDLAHCLRPVLDHLDVPEAQASGKTAKQESKAGPTSESDTVELQVRNSFCTLYLL